MIANFKEKFKGNNKLIRIAEMTTAVPVIILWVFVLRKQTGKICEKLIQTDNVFQEIVLATPIHLGYLLFYWSVISWMVYYAVKALNPASEGNR